jgi:hypothetical protein
MILRGRAPCPGSRRPRWREACEKFRSFQDYGTERQRSGEVTGRGACVLLLRNYWEMQTLISESHTCRYDVLSVLCAAQFIAKIPCAAPTRLFISGGLCKGCSRGPFSTIHTVFSNRKRVGCLQTHDSWRVHYTMYCLHRQEAVVPDRKQPLSSVCSPPNHPRRNSSNRLAHLPLLAILTLRLDRKSPTTRFSPHFWV